MRLMVTASAALVLAVIFAGQSAVAQRQRGGRPSGDEGQGAGESSHQSQRVFPPGRPTQPDGHRPWAYGNSPYYGRPWSYGNAPYYSRPWAYGKGPYYRRPPVQYYPYYVVPQPYFYRPYGYPVPYFQPYYLY